MVRMARTKQTARKHPPPNKNTLQGTQRPDTQSASWSESRRKRSKLPKKQRRMTEHYDQSRETDEERHTDSDDPPTDDERCDEHTDLKATHSDDTVSDAHAPWEGRSFPTIHHVTIAGKTMPDRKSVV